MNWNSWTDFLALGGYGPYVWGAYLIALAVVIIELVLLRLRHRSILRYFGNARRDESHPTSAGSATHGLDSGST